MKCLACKADAMKDTVSTYFAQPDHCCVIIKNVPCKQCTQCGETVYSASVLEKIDQIQIFHYFSMTDLNMKRRLDL